MSIQRWRSRIAGVLVLLTAACAGDADRGLTTPAPSAGPPATTSAIPASAASATAPATTASAAATAASAPAIPKDWRFKKDTPVATGARGMVTSDAKLATQAGVDILKAGGNAIDAAVATALALAVVYPQAGNLGGGGFMLVRGADGKASAIDFRETAPGAATRTMYQGKPDKPSITGHLASGVPGSVAGLWDAHKRLGSVPWKDVCAPAIKLAEEGFKVDEELSRSLGRFVERLGKFPPSAALFLPGGKPPEVGSTHKNPDLAKVLRRVADRGPAGFYEGETAKLIVAEMKKGGGIITLADLKGYKTRFREPVEVDYRGHRVISMPLPSSGGLVLALLLRILEGFDMGKVGYQTADAVHIEAESMRRAFALRNEHLGDPDFVKKVPVDLFLSDESVKRLRASIAMDKATPSSEITSIGVPDVDKKHTTHLSVVDEKGVAVALTTTINTSYGSGVTVTGAGFLMNNEMDDFTTELGKPNLFGLVQGEANAIQPGKRMLSSMTPTIVVGPDGKVLLVAGAAGGPTIITAVFHVLSNAVDYKMPIELAQSAPRFHHQHLPDQIFYEEGGLREDVLKVLAARGHKVATRQHIGDAPSILRQGNAWTGIGEPRNTSSSALGY